VFRVSVPVMKPLNRASNNVIQIDLRPLVTVATTRRLFRYDRTFFAFAVATTSNEIHVMPQQHQQLQLAQHYCAAVNIEPIPLKRLVQLAELMDSPGAIQQLDTPVHLPTLPVITKTEDGQFEVLNVRQVLLSANHSRLHPQSQVLVCRLIDPSDLPISRLFYDILEPARQLGEIDPLIHVAQAGDHQTALLNQQILIQGPGQPITTKQIVKLCGGRVQRSTINQRKKKLGYTNPGRGCKARKNDTSNDARLVHAS